MLWNGGKLSHGWLNRSALRPLPCIALSPSTWPRVEAGLQLGEPHYCDPSLRVPSLMRQSSAFLLPIWKGVVCRKGSPGPQGMRQDHDLSQGRKVLAYPPMWPSGICCPLQCPCRGQESPRVSPWDELRSQKETIRRNSRAQAGPGPSARPWHLQREAEIFRKLGVGRQELAWKRPSTGPSSSAPLAKQSFHRTDGETEAPIGLLPWQPRPVQIGPSDHTCPWRVSMNTVRFPGWG